MDGNRAVRYRRDDLAQRFGLYIAHRIDAGQIGAGGFIRYNISGAIPFQLAGNQFGGRLVPNADEYCVASQVVFFAGMQVLQPYTGKFVAVKQPGDRAVPAKFRVFGLLQGFVANSCGPQSTPAVNQNDFLGNASEQQSVFGGGIAANHDHII